MTSLITPEIALWKLLDSLRSLEMSWKECAEYLGVAPRTLVRWRERLEYIDPMLDDDEYSDTEIAATAHGGSRAAAMTYLRRPVYDEVFGMERVPHLVWHVEANFDLAEHYHIVIHMVVDDFSRSVLAIRAVDHHREDCFFHTVFDAVISYGVPLLVHVTQPGHHNQWIYQFMEEQRGRDCVFLEPAHARMTRVWKEVQRMTLQSYQDLFTAIDDDIDYNPRRVWAKQVDRRVFLAVLHFVFLPKLNADLQSYCCDVWNQQSLWRTAYQRSPQQLLTLHARESVAIAFNQRRMKEDRYRVYEGDEKDPLTVPVSLLDSGVLTERQLQWFRQRCAPIATDVDWQPEVFMETFFQALHYCLRVQGS